MNEDFDPMDNPRYYEQKCNIYRCDFGESGTDDTCMYCGNPNPKNRS